MIASVVINLRSGGAHKALRSLPQRLAAHGIDVAAIVTVEDSTTLFKRVRKLVQRGAAAILVGGGDGSMAEAAGALADRETILGVLPLGTGNSFAQTLGIGTALDRAIEIIAGGRIAAVDLGIVNGRYFANFATIGLSAEIAAKTPHALKGIIGSAAYAVGGIVPFVRARPFRARIRWPQGEFDLRTYQMVIASGRLFGTAPVLPDASITDGKLAFFTSDGLSHFDLARMYVAFGLGLQTRLPDAVTLTAGELCIKTKGKQPINIDGNPAGTTPARFAVARAALRVFVPASFGSREH